MHSTPPSLLDQLRGPMDQQAWERFVQLYTPLLCHWARRLDVPGSDVGDFVQDVLTLLVQKLPEFHYDPARRFRGWLWTVTLNRWRATGRRRSATGKPVSAERLDACTVEDPALALDEAEYREYVVGRALELMQTRFTPATWQAFWELAVAGRPASAVAGELGISENAVYIAKFRVLRHLRRELDGLLD